MFCGVLFLLFVSLQTMKRRHLCKERATLKLKIFPPNSPGHRALGVQDQDLTGGNRIY